MQSSNVVSGSDTVTESEFLAVAQRVFDLGGKIALQLCEAASVEDNIRTGGVFALTAPLTVSATRESLKGTTQRVGELSEEDSVRFAKNAIAKNIAMFDQNSVSSASIADDAASPPIYGGGIQLSNGWYLSFSGLPPEFDEVVCLHTGHGADLLTDLRINTILSRSPQQVLIRVLLTDTSFSVAKILYDLKNE